MRKKREMREKRENEQRERENNIDDSETTLLCEHTTPEHNQFDQIHTHTKNK